MSSKIVKIQALANAAGIARGEIAEVPEEVARRLIKGGLAREHKIHIEIPKVQPKGTQESPAELAAKESPNDQEAQPKRKAKSSGPKGPRSSSKAPTPKSKTKEPEPEPEETDEQEDETPDEETPEQES